MTEPTKGSPYLLRVASGEDFELWRALAEDAEDAGSLGRVLFGDLAGPKVGLAVANHGDSGISLWQSGDDPARSVTSMYWVLRSQGTTALVAIVGLYQPRWIGRQNYYLGWFGVHPSLEGRGVGTALLEYVAERARSNGARGLFTETAPTPTETVRFYEKRGFAAVGQAPDYWEEGEALLLMRRQL